MRRLFTLAAHSGEAFAPLTSSTVTWASRTVGAVTFGVLVLFPPPQAAVSITLNSAASRATELVRFIEVPKLSRTTSASRRTGVLSGSASHRCTATAETRGEFALRDQEDDE